MADWISVQDKLPNPGEQVLVWAFPQMKGGDFSEIGGGSLGYILEDGSWRYGEHEQPAIVTYWAEIGSPPGEGRT